MHDHQVTDAVLHRGTIVLDGEREDAVVVEPRRVTRIVRLREGDSVVEYRRVTHQFGQVVHFRNGIPCTQREFDRAVWAGRYLTILADASAGERRRDALVLPLLHRESEATAPVRAARAGDGR